MRSLKFLESSNWWRALYLPQPGHIRPRETQQ